MKLQAFQTALHAIYHRSVFYAAQGWIAIMPCVGRVGGPCHLLTDPCVTVVERQS